MIVTRDTLGDNDDGLDCKISILSMPSVRDTIIGAGTGGLNTPCFGVLHLLPTLSETQNYSLAIHDSMDYGERGRRLSTISMDIANRQQLHT